MRIAIYIRSIRVCSFAKNFSLEQRQHTNTEKSDELNCVPGNY